MKRDGFQSVKGPVGINMITEYPTYLGVSLHLLNFRHFRLHLISRSPSGWPLNSNADALKGIRVTSCFEPTLQIFSLSGKPELTLCVSTIKISWLMSQDKKSWKSTSRILTVKFLFDFWSTSLKAYVGLLHQLYPALSLKCCIHYHQRPFLWPQRKGSSIVIGDCPFSWLSRSAAYPWRHVFHPNISSPFNGISGAATNGNNFMIPGTGKTNSMAFVQK